MNCQEIARVLDSRDVNGLSAVERDACDAHAMSCPRCAPTWVVYTRLAAIPVPPMSPEFVARCEALAMTPGRVTPLRRASSRGVLIGTILVVAAAAAMLSMRLMDGQPDAPAAESAAAAVTGEPGDSSVALEASRPAADEPVAGEDHAAIDAPVAAITVQVLPLRNEVKHPAGRKAVSSTYAAFIERLRGVPGVTVVVADSGATASPAPNYRISMTGEEGIWGPDSDHKFGGRFQTDILMPNGAARIQSYGSYSVQVAPGCVTDPQAHGLETGRLVCSDAEGTAANLVGNLRKSEFPPDPALRRELKSRLLDRSLDVLQRQQALNDLVRFGGGYGGYKAFIEYNKNLADPALIRGAVDLATTSSDPKVRAGVWTVLRGSGNTGLISPLLAALGRDADGDVRLHAVVMLAGEFAGDARVQAALAVASRQDTRPLVRAVAHRASAGSAAEADWRKYIVASLKDSSRPAAERVEALLHQMNLGPTSHRFGSATSTIVQSLEMLDDDAIRTLALTLPEVATQSPVMLQAAYTLLGNMGQSDRPAVTELLLDLLDSGTTKLSRENTTELLGERARELGDARAYAMLEKLSANDPDPRVRQVAADALKAKASAPPAGRPQTLGVNLQVVEARVDVPEDIVGKLQVRAVGSGTVAQKAGVMPLDVLLEINGKPIDSGAGLIQTLEALPQGVDIEVLVQRAGMKVRLIARF